MTIPDGGNMAIAIFLGVGTPGSALKRLSVGEFIVLEYCNVYVGVLLCVAESITETPARYNGRPWLLAPTEMAVCCEVTRRGTCVL